MAQYMTRLREYNSLARAWWRHDRLGWHLYPKSMSERQVERVGDTSDAVTALFESVYSIDKMLDALVRHSRTDDELAFIGTMFLEYAANTLGRDLALTILDDMPLMSAAQKAAVKSGFAR